MYITNLLVVWSGFCAVMKPIVNERSNVILMFDYWGIYIQWLFSLGSDKNNGTAKQVTRVKPSSQKY